jgi:cysteinyl-tRNA synthetase
LIADRVAARTAKNWAEADRIRQVLTDMGVIVMDNPTGATWRRTT